MRNQILTIIFLSLSIGLLGQEKHIGSAFITNYSPTDYDAGNQNWAIAQSDDGILYFGNNEGIIEFDGNNWRNIDPAYIVSAEKDKNGTIFMGGRENLGFLKQKENGTVLFKSLKNLIKDTSYTIRYIRRIVFHENEVWFSDENGHILKYNGQTISIQKASSWIGLFQKINDTIYIQTRDGLGIYTGKRISVIPGGEIFSELSLRNIHKIGKDLLFITRTNGIYKKTSSGFAEWETPYNKLIKQSQVYASTSKNDQLILGTVESGVIVLNQNGDKTLHMNEKSGMINQDHCSIFIDHDGNIWSGLEFGISQIHFNSPFSYFNKSSGLNNSAIYAMKLLYGELFTGTARGLYKSTWKPFTKQPDFKLIEGNSGRKLWDFALIQKRLFTSSSNIGMHVIKGYNAEKIPQSPNINKFIPTENPETFVGIGEHGGLYTLKFHENKLVKTIYHDEVPILSNAILIDHILWGLNHNNTIIKYNFSKDFRSIISEKCINECESLSPKLKKSLFEFNGKLLIGTDSGTYEIDREKDIFKRYINQKDHASLHIFKVEKDTLENWWIIGKNNKQPILAKMNNDGTISNMYPFSFDNLAIKDNLAFYPIDSTQVLIGTSDRLVVYNASQKSLRKSKNQLLIRSIILNKTGDSLNIANNPESASVKAIEYSNNALTFKYTLINFNKNSSVQYRSKIDGFDNNWSSFTNKTEKEYNYLPEGDYTFKVRAYLSEKLIDEQQYQFSIKPPWYRTIWAYFIYLAIITAILMAIRYLSIKKVEKEKIKLENEVNKRTHEIQRKNSQLEMQKEEISAQRDEISLQQQKMVDSIEYAKHIQGALLPDKNLFKLYFKDSFIIFKPKDIVSGDFYWLKKIKNHLLYTVADCTGHGVPGAFMSIMGISFLNEIVRRTEIESPNMVLDELNIQVKQSLTNPSISESGENEIQQYLQSEVKDGIEMAFVDIDLENNTLYFAGAESPLYIIRNKQLIILEGTPIPVGIHYKNIPFELQKMELKTNDSIYLFTDGYKDQFSSDTQTKFSSEKFKKLLMEIHTKPFSQQKDILCETLANWQGKYDQIDDITVLGVRI